MNKRYYILILTIMLIFNSSFAKEQQEERINDYLYSEAYFDYLIECANIQKIEEERLKQEEAQKAELELSIEDEEEINIFENDSDLTEAPIFKLRVEEITTKPYKETFKITDNKTIIPVNDSFSFTQNVSKFKNNKYNSDDYRLISGIEYKPIKFLTLASGLETNYRGVDQNPNSRKIFFTPSLNLSDKLSISFYNKYNVITRETDHDIGLNLSPFKSKVADFRVYAGVTKKPAGNTSESINFTTNIYLY